MRTLLLSLSLIAAFYPTRSVAQTSTATRCQLVMLTADIERGLKPEYFQKFLTDLNKNKIVQVNDQAAIQDQGSRGFCHMYSLYEELVHKYKVRNNDQDPNISIYYWAYYHWLGRAIETVKDVNAGNDIPEGNWYEGTFDLIKKYGVMTSEQWARLGGRTDIQLSIRNGIELGQLNTIVEKAHMEKQLLLKIIQPVIPAGKTKGDYFTGILMSPQVSQQFKNFVQRKTIALGKKETAFTAAQIKILAEITKGQMRGLDLKPSETQAMIGALDKDLEEGVKTEFSYIFFSQKINPLIDIQMSDQVHLSKVMFPELSQKTLTFVTDGARRGRVDYQGRDSDHLVFKAPLDKMLSLIKDEIDKDNSVWIGYDHNSYFVDNLTGAMTIEGMKTLPVNPHIGRNERGLMDLAYGGHATQIVGYELNSKNEIVALKMQNSWSEAAGKKGYYRMDMSYFRAYIWRVTVRDEKGEFTPDIIRQLDQSIKPQ